MAKANRSGLGRGLNSLLGGAYEEAAPPDVVPQRVLVQQEEPEGAARQDEPMGRQVEEFVEESSEESVVDDEDRVTIKSVTQRRTDEVPIDSVSPNPDQPRTNFKREELEELAASIEKDGLLQPILVRPMGSQKYQIIAGAPLAGMQDGGTSHGSRSHQRS